MHIFINIGQAQMGGRGAKQIWGGGQGPPQAPLGAATDCTLVQLTLILYSFIRH